MNFAPIATQNSWARPPRIEDVLHHALFLVVGLLDQERVVLDRGGGALVVFLRQGGRRDKEQEEGGKRAGN